MRLKQMTAACLMGAIALGCGWLEAQNTRGFPFAARKSAPAAVSELTEEAGPWLVMCASFVGDYADDEAQQLASELGKAGFRTYTYRKDFDYSQPIVGLFASSDPENVDVLPDGQIVPKRQMMKAARASEIREVAVLVGDFPTIDDNRAQQALERIKSLPVNSGGQLSHDVLASSFRTAENLARTETSAGRGPLKAAFLITNPMLPDEYFAGDAVDREIIDLNRDFQYSLLSNRGNYSVRIATFRGEQTFQPDRIVEEEKRFFNLLKKRGSVQNSKLMEAGLKASVLTKVLRDEGIDAWEFHDRFESYVCVGSFDWITRENDLGVTEYNPEIVDLVNQYRGGTATVKGNNVVSPKSHKKLSSLGIVYDVQPMPVQVPRPNPTGRSTARR